VVLDEERHRPAAGAYVWHPHDVAQAPVPQHEHAHGPQPHAPGWQHAQTERPSGAPAFAGTHSQRAVFAGAHEHEAALGFWEVDMVSLLDVRASILGRAPCGVRRCQRFTPADARGARTLQAAGRNTISETGP